MDDLLTLLRKLDGLSPDDASFEPTVDAMENGGSPLPKQAAAVAEVLHHAATLDGGYWAATLLGRLEAAGAPGLPALIEALDHSPHLAVRERAAWALGKIGPPAKEAIPLLEKAAREPQPRLARMASEAIAAIKPS